MAAVSWTQRPVKAGVLLTGTVRLSCRHHVKESAQVRNRPADIEQGKRTVSRLLEDKIAAHRRGCNG